MNDNSEKHIEKLVDKLMKENTLQTPSFDFTANVMSQIKALSSTNVFIYKPLISKIGWFFIGFALLALTIFIAFSIKTESTGFLSTIDFSVLTNNKITKVFSGFKISGFEVSKTLSYSLLLLGIMVCVQIPFLKHHFNQRFEN
ncbi:MAG: hypothetical protein GW839_01400 [Flavobacteriales bacterium]|nr:hypothetical protein [Flavobacteriia bacterium]NCP04766.1 hypothetical protein [Flavobacteriales bacterium]PIV92654.1 MAG: hypothetical protein COW44_13805 [Flavobacteriaceae bacterium CG17_big_fil_post_rev_8_21_14_2_50_33_15]PIY11116.1 MAG: hypothetical protein COZ17_07740 [Flavobacteriaceae bacterium CG_4_10_14_3_um_filter_33_47]PJB17801.1 MAG: hypothetical protein CO117_10105 [Flavobacteriaceae bacterium CG_4_9_14_3_um_filter_33_16]